MSNKIEEKFWEFHKENPHVYELFDRFAQEAVKSGRDVFSIAMLTERIRWYTDIETTGSEFKISNNFRAYYARLWMKNNPEHNGLFRIKKLRAGKESKSLTVNREGE